MHLTMHADYALRILIYLGAHPDTVVPVVTISQSYGISRNHLLKVQHRLTELGYLKAMRGRTGGIVLARAPETINIGEVVRAMEPSFAIVECFDPERDTCPITPVCGLKPVLGRAQASFMSVLDACTLDQIIGPRRLHLAERLAARPAPPPAVPKVV
jgi:Rrf2 family transcriptional regulator, nitric oxide-sensitive transcriptional repressor